MTTITRCLVAGGLLDTASRSFYLSVGGAHDRFKVARRVSPTSDGSFLCFLFRLFPSELSRSTRRYGVDFLELLFLRDAVGFRLWGRAPSNLKFPVYGYLLVWCYKESFFIGNDSSFYYYNYSTDTGRRPIVLIKKESDELNTLCLKQ